MTLVLCWIWSNGLTRLVGTWLITLDVSRLAEIKKHPSGWLSNADSTVAGVVNDIYFDLVLQPGRMLSTRSISRRQTSLVGLFRWIFVRKASIPTHVAQQSLDISRYVVGHVGRSGRHLFMGMGFV
jgi:hypothetical protein